MLSHSVIQIGKQNLQTNLDGVELTVLCYPIREYSRSETIFHYFYTGTPIRFSYKSFHGLIHSCPEQERVKVYVFRYTGEYYREIWLSLRSNSPYGLARSTIVALKYFLTIFQRGSSYD